MVKGIQRALSKLDLTSKNYIFGLAKGSSISTDTTLTGLGTTISPLSVVQNYITLIGNQTIADIKTFTSSPVIPEPTTDYQAATKKYVDENKGGSGLPLFASLYLDYIPTDAAYVLADGASYVSGTVYSTAYDHLLTEYNLATDTTETVAGVTVTFRRAADGHKIISYSNEANYNSVLTATGTAWYYVLDTANTRFRLPYTEFFIQGGATTFGSMAAYQAAGLPNITGDGGGYLTSASGSTTGAIVNNAALGNGSPISGSASRRMEINASLSSSIYGSSTTVQPKANKLGLFFVCGNSVTNTYLIDAAGLADKDLNNITDIALNKISANPITTIIMSPLATPPTGYLYCNGAVISRTTYAALFAAIGTLYGAGDGSTTFSLPDFRGRFLRAYDGVRSAAVGLYQNDGAPNIIGTIHPVTGTYNTYPGGFAQSGALWATDGGQNTYTGGQAALKYAAIQFSASKSNAIYGASNYIQPYNSAVYMYIKY